MNFVFYDTETTGINTAFDQILQFGAIKTDSAFNELERFEIRCRLLPYVVPAPGAMRVTGVTVEQLTDPKLPSQYQMVQRMRAKMAEWSPALFIGYNSLDFDEHLLRQAFYKSLYPPYLTNTNGNSRADCLRMVRALAHFAPDALTIPRNDAGRLVFKLDRVAPANGFDHSAAHDAMGDVEATVHLCRLIAERKPDQWSSFVQFAKKSAAIEYAQGEEVFGLTDFFYAKPYSWMVTSIGPNPEYFAELLVFDLSVDPVPLASLTDDKLAKRLSRGPKPVRAMRCNAAPVISHYDKMPEAMREALPSLKVLQARADYIKSDPDLSGRLISAFLKTREARYNQEPSVHVEEQIYDRFANRDEPLMRQFHSFHWGDRVSLMPAFDDDRMRLLASRLIYTEAPDVMDQAERRQFDLTMARRLMAEQDTVPWLTLPKAIEDAKDLLVGAKGVERALLSDLRDYLISRAKDASTMLA